MLVNDPLVRFYFLAGLQALKNPMLEVSWISWPRCFFLQNRCGKEQDIRQELHQFLHAKDLHLPYVDPVIRIHN